jgi:NAD(P)H-flavin reductase
LRAFLLALIDDLDDYKRVFFRYGARSPRDIVFRDAATRGWGRGDDLDVLLTVDVGDPQWDGHVGVLPTILTEEYLDCDPGKNTSTVTPATASRSSAARH